MAMCHSSMFLVFYDSFESLPPTCIDKGLSLSVDRCAGPHQQTLYCVGCSHCSMVALPQNGSNVFAMRHQKRVARLGRPADQRKALVRSLTTEVLRHGRITTTKVPPSSCCLSHNSMRQRSATSLSVTWIGVWLLLFLFRNCRAALVLGQCIDVCLCCVRHEQRQSGSMWTR